LRLFARAAEVDRHLGAGELGQALAAAAARRAVLDALAVTATAVIAVSAGDDIAPIAEASRALALG